MDYFVLFLILAGALTQSTIDPSSIPKFVTNISIAPLAFKPIVNSTTLQKSYSVIIKQVDQQILPVGYPTTSIYAYGGNTYDPLTNVDMGLVHSFPGPTFVLSRGSPIKSTWQNRLTGKHMFAIETNLNFMQQIKDFQNFIPTVVHAHGMANPSATDGIPEGWFTSSGETGSDYYSQETMRFNRSTVAWLNEEEESTLFYHDHAMAMTRLNVYAGLSGLILIQDKLSPLSRLFDVHHDIQMMISDRTFNQDGSFFYPSKGHTREFPVWVPEFYGDCMLVNGKTWPNMNVERNSYRVRIVNGCNGRMLTLSFFDEDNGLQIPFTLYKADACYYDKPLVLTEVQLPVSGRIQLVIDFTQVKGRRIIMKNSHKMTSHHSDGLKDQNVEVVMSITPSIKSLHRIVVPQPNGLNPYLEVFPMFALSVSNRYVVLAEVVDDYGNPIGTYVDGVGMDVAHPPFQLNQMYDIYWINLTPDMHPVHIHLVNFEYYKVADLDAEAYQTEWEKINNGPPPYPTNPKALNPSAFIKGGWRQLDGINRVFKDVENVLPESVAVFRFRFKHNNGANFSFDVRKGRFVLHCHLLEHEDNEMMRYFSVV